MIPFPDVNRGSKEPLYNIGVVARMTGVSMATLRAWERRYKFPESERTAGGHRLYSERDVLRLRWVKERIDDGMQTAQAIHALRHHETLGGLPPAAPVPQPTPPSVLHPQESLTQAHLQQTKDRLVHALMEGELTHADIIIGEALAIFSPEDLIMDVIGPAFTEIGEVWEKGQISVAGEHLATNYLRQRLLMWMVSGPPPRAVKPILLACAPEEWHEGSLLILGALLRRLRWPIAYLGQAVPLPDLANFIREVKPSLIVLVAMTEPAAAQVSSWPQWLGESSIYSGPPVGFGGRVYVTHPDWRTRMPGIYLGDTIREGIENIESILGAREQ